MPTAEELKRKKIKRTTNDLDIYSLNDTLGNLVSLFQSYANTYGEDATLDIEHYGYGDYDSHISVKICYLEEETDDAYATRIKRIEAREFKKANPSAAQLASQERHRKIAEKKAAAEREKDLKLLAALKKKYES